MTQIVAVDLGGTRVRFAIADIHEGSVNTLGDPVVFECAQFADFPAAWTQFANGLPTPPPNRMSLAVASPVREGPFTLTNLNWIIDRDAFMRDLGLERLLLLNDFVAVGHAVAQLESHQFTPISGPDRAMADARVITAIGPGTGLGVAQILRRGARYDVVHTEGGHIGYAPADAADDAVLAAARAQHSRVSAERILSGPGLRTIHAAVSKGASAPDTDRALWIAALEGHDAAMHESVEQFARALGRFAGDMALAHGADALVVAGGLGQRLFATPHRSAFVQGFHDKGRFTQRMASICVSILTHPQPGLYGAAAAFAQEMHP